MESYKLFKYPRTPHLEGSRLGPGDEDLSQIPFFSIAGKKIVVEEKCDGANSAVSFDGDGNLLLQSRGHYLTGGYREKHYNLMKQWANLHRDTFFSVLGERYILVCLCKSFWRFVCYVEKNLETAVMWYRRALKAPYYNPAVLDKSYPGWFLTPREKNIVFDNWSTLSKCGSEEEKSLVKKEILEMCALESV